MKRKLLAVTLAVLVAAGAFVLWPRTEPIMKSKFRRIQGGMTGAEVEAIMVARPTRAHFRPLGFAAYTFMEWEDSESVFHADFDSEDRVTQLHQWQKIGPVESRLNSICDRFVDIWRKWFP